MQVQSALSSQIIEVLLHQTISLHYNWKECPLKNQVNTFPIGKEFCLQRTAAPVKKTTSKKKKLPSPYCSLTTESRSIYYLFHAGHVDSRILSPVSDQIIILCILPYRDLYLGRACCKLLNYYESWCFFKDLLPASTDDTDRMLLICWKLLPPGARLGVGKTIFSLKLFIQIMIRLHH